MPIKDMFKFISVVLFLFVTAPQFVSATTVLQVDMDYLLTEAGLVFEGEALSSEARWNNENTSITTFITFRVDEVIKGEHPQPTLTLEFAGGTVGDTGLHVSAMVYPPVGESGIYFIENPGVRQVNPLLGWGQGHFRIQNDNQGTGRVFSEAGAPVLSLDFAPVNGAGENHAGHHSQSPFSHGVARGVRTGSRDAPVNTAMEKRHFKDALKARLAIIKSRAATTPAGGHDDH